VGLEVHDVTNDTWSESAITFNTAPTISAPVVDFVGPITAGQTYELDVTSLVAGNGLVSFGLKTTHTTALSLSSRESANPPQLVVESGAASTPTVAPTVSPPDGGPDGESHSRCHSTAERETDGCDTQRQHLPCRREMVRGQGLFEFARQERGRKRHQRPR
jgi:hypothetical protein